MLKDSKRQFSVFKPSPQTTLSNSGDWFESEAKIMVILAKLIFRHASKAKENTRINSEIKTSLDRKRTTVSYSMSRYHI
jgi:hypothetical protein